MFSLFQRGNNGRPVNSSPPIIRTHFLSLWEWRFRERSQKASESTIQLHCSQIFSAGQIVVSNSDRMHHLPSLFSKLSLQFRNIVSNSTKHKSLFSKKIQRCSRPISPPHPHWLSQSMYCASHSSFKYHFE